MEFIRADKLGFNPRPQMSMVFVEGFYQWLKALSKDKEKLVRAFEHIFNLDKFFAAVDGDKIASLTACTDGKERAVKLDKDILRRELGFIRGWITYKMLTKHMLGRKYPFELAADIGSIEFVATSPEYRGQGVAYSLISHIMETMALESYVLEVADTNTTALRLYESLGFRERARVKSVYKNAGFDYYLYLECMYSQR